MTPSLFALRALLNALVPLVGAEAELGNKAVSTGWANGFDEGKIKELRSTGADLVEKELNNTFQTEFEAEYHARMNKVGCVLTWHLLAPDENT